MRSLPSLRRFKSPPTLQTLVDIALVVAILPHLFTLKLPVLLYLLSSALMLLKADISKTMLFVFMLLGAISILLGFYAQYSVAGLSRMLVFVSLVVSLLVLAVTLQRMSRKMNFYLLFSPVLLFILAFFFFNTITMLFYAVFTLFLFLLLFVWYQMQSPLDEAVRMTSTLFALALPVVVVLFMLFPRISFQKSTFGFKSDVIARSGHDGTMHLDSRALLVPSERIVMEVLFEERVPRDDQLYFRGTVLYQDNVEHWEAMPSVKGRPDDLDVQIGAGSVLKYEVTLYPHQRRWLYTLDLPITYPDKSRIDEDLIVTYEHKVDEKLRYKVSSALVHTHFPAASDRSLRWASATDPSRDPKSVEVIKRLGLDGLDDSEKARALIAFLRSQGLVYTLRPDALDLAHPTDSFLFDKKRGYCVHFAAAFASLARIAGIPSRIVTGFKAERKNAIGNYLVIRESDAHAWVELYLHDRGWVRFEPTATAIATDQGKEASAADSLTDAAGRDVQMDAVTRLWHQSELYFMYGKFIIEHWVLHYSRVRQSELWHDVLEDSLTLAKIIGGLFLLLLFSYVLLLMSQRSTCVDKASCVMDPLLRRLERKGLKRSGDETMRRFLRRVQAGYPQITEFVSIDRLYHEVRYSRAGESELALLEAAVESCLEVMGRKGR